MPYDPTLVEDADQRRKAKSSAKRARHRDFVQQQAQIEELANEYVGMWLGQAESVSDDGEPNPTKRSQLPTEAEQEAASRSRGGLMFTRTAPDPRRKPMPSITPL
jgi:hypothetical protein